MSESKSKEKEGWYPGKYIKKRSVKEPSPSSSPSSPTKRKEEAPEELPHKSSISSDTSASSGGSNSKEGWYPGKMLGFKPPKDANSKRGALIRERFPIAGNPPVKSVGNVVVKILGVKYMSATRPSFEVWVGKQLETFQFLGLEQDGSCNEEFEGYFALGDLTSDIFILVKEEYSVGGKNRDGENFVGRVVIPVSSYLTMNGRLPPKKEWMAIYPLANPQNPMEEYKEGLAALPGSAMPKSKHSLGFICVQIELLLPEGPVYYQYLEGEPPREPFRALKSSVAETENATDDTLSKRPKGFSHEQLYRVCRRLQEYFNGPPAALSPVLKFPEVFVLIALYWCLCFGASVPHIPVILFLLIALNGILSNKDYKSSVILWNEMLDHDSSATLTDSQTGKSIPLTAKRSSEYVYAHLQGPLYECQEFLENVVNFLETMSNIWNFSDLRVSAIFYGCFGAFTLFSTVILVIFSARLLFFIVGAAALLINAMRDVFPEFFCLQKLYDMSTSPSENTDDKLQHARNAFTKLWLALSRIPNEATLIHRYIARTCVVEDGGDEMKDAALKLKNM